MVRKGRDVQPPPASVLYVRMRLRRPLAAIVAVIMAVGVAAIAAQPLLAQDVIRPAQRWESLTTAHFTVLFPATTRDWAVDLRSRLEPMGDAAAPVVEHVRGR